MEVAGDVSHNTAFVRPRDVAQVRYFEQLLEVVLERALLLLLSRGTHRYAEMIGGYLECKSSVTMSVRLQSGQALTMIYMDVTDLI